MKTAIVTGGSMASEKAPRLNLTSVESASFLLIIPIKKALMMSFVAKELAPRKIRVNAVSPDPVHTHISEGAFGKHPEFIKPLAEQTALGRIGSPRDVANVIVHLLSDDFGWVTAQ